MNVVKLGNIRADFLKQLGIFILCGKLDAEIPVERIWQVVILVLHFLSLDGSIIVTSHGFKTRAHRQPLGQSECHSRLCRSIQTSHEEEQEVSKSWPHEFWH